QSTLRGLWRQYRQYGFWKVRVIQKHGRPASWRHLVPGAFVAALALGPVALLVTGLGTPLALLAAAYAVFVGAASVRLAGRRGLVLLPRIAAALVTLHVAYGVGFWQGLATFGVPRPGLAEPVFALRGDER